MILSRFAGDAPDFWRATAEAASGVRPGVED